MRQVVAKAVLPWSVAEVNENGGKQAKYLMGLALMRCPVQLTSFYWSRQGTQLNPKSRNVEIRSTILFVGETETSSIKDMDALGTMTYSVHVSYRRVLGENAT